MQHAKLNPLVSRFVSGTTSLAAELVEREGVASRAKSAAQLNEFVSSLSSTQRKSLAQLLQLERRTTLFDALLFLEEEVAKHKWQVSIEGQPLELESQPYTLAEQYLAQVEHQGS
jgi:hypothetical protein